MDKMGYDQMLKYRGVTVDGRSPGYLGEQKPRPSIPPNHKTDSNSLKPCQSQVQIKSANYTHYPQSKSIHHFVEDKQSNIPKLQFQPLQLPNAQMQFSKNPNELQYQPQMQQPMMFPPQQMQQPIIMQPQQQMMMQPPQQMMMQPQSMQQPMVLQPSQIQPQMIQPQQMPPQQSFFMPQPQQIQPPMENGQMPQNVPTFILPSQSMLKQQMQMQMQNASNPMNFWNR